MVHHVQTKAGQAGPSSSCKPEQFAGLDMKINHSEPAIRHERPLVTDSYERRRAIARAKIGKVWHDMQRHVLFQVEAALAHQVKLPFKMADLERLHDRQQIPMNSPRCLPDLAMQGVTRLKAADGPALVIDLDDAAVFWYFPRFIGKSLQTELLQAIRELAAVYRPKVDSEVHDRRSQPETADIERETMIDADRVVTRSQASQLGSVHDVARVSGPEREISGEARMLGSLTHGLVLTPQLVSPEPCPDIDGDIDWSASAQEHPNHCITSVKPCTSTNPLTVMDFLSSQPPFAYNFSPGWFGTGQENKHPITMSSHFKAALRDECSTQTIALLRAKRLFDYQLGFLTDIIHLGLADSMRSLKTRMSTICGPTSVALENGWTSAFPCVTMAVNRTSRLHRDSKGIRAGMDIIGVLGTFDHGGDLGLADLNVEAEWVPGCLGAFDGYDLRHQVRPWSGGTRVALISFCRASTWKGLKLECSLARPKLPDIKARLQAAKDARASSVAKAQQSLKEQQQVERQKRENDKSLARARCANELKQLSGGGPMGDVTSSLPSVNHFAGSRKRDIEEEDGNVEHVLRAVRYKGRGYRM